MRLLEAVSYPSVNVNYPIANANFGTTYLGPNSYTITSDFGNTTSDNSNTVVTPTKILFPVPRLGRVWSVDRLVFALTTLSVVNPNLGAVDETVSLKLTPKLNETPVGELVTIKIPLPKGGPKDYSHMLPPLTTIVSFFTDISITSSDQMALESSMIYETAPSQGLAAWINCRLTVSGDNDSRSS